LPERAIGWLRPGSVAEGRLLPRPDPVVAGRWLWAQAAWARGSRDLV